MLGALLMLMDKEAFMTVSEQEKLIEFDPVSEFESFENEYIQNTTEISSVTDSTIG